MLGAKITQIVNLFIKDFIALVIAANIIAWPVAYYVMQHVLRDYAYRISVGIHYFIFAGILSVVLALLTILFLAVRAAAANPAEALRSE